MPIPITKYLCQFKCGRKAMHSKNAAIQHEIEFCFKNPANKTCATCYHEVYGVEDNVYYRGCELPIMDEFIESVIDNLTVEVGRNIRCLWGCPNHDKIDVDKSVTEAYILDVKTRMDNKKNADEVLNNLFK